MDRRTFLGSLGGGFVAGVSGCLSTGPNRKRTTNDRQLDPRSGGRSETEFVSFAGETHERYGTSGIWGTAQSEPAHELNFQRAWTETLTHQDGVQSEHVLALYRLPSASDGTTASQVWLWSGIDPAGAGSVRRLKTGFTLDDAASLGIYSPGQDYSADETATYPVESGRLDVDTLSAELPLPAGHVGVGEQTQVGAGGAYFPYWDGDYGSAHGLAATTTIQWEGLPTSALSWRIEVGMAP